MFDVWKNVLAEVEQSIPREQYSTWFTGTELVNIDDGVVTIGVPNVFKIKQLEKKYFGILRDAFLHNNVNAIEIRYIVQSNVKPRVRAREIPVVSSAAMVPTQVARTVDNDRISSMSKSFQTGLNPRYSLANFVIGSNNDLAVSVARNIIDQPGGSYNPFFLYGGPGLGKTHLVQAIGNELLAKNPKLKVLYTPVSSFYSDFIKSLQNKKAMSFGRSFVN